MVEKFLEYVYNTNDIKNIHNIELEACIASYTEHVYSKINDRVGECTSCTYVKFDADTFKKDLIEDVVNNITTPMSDVYHAPSEIIALFMSIHYERDEINSDNVVIANSVLCVGCNQYDTGNVEKAQKIYDYYMSNYVRDNIIRGISEVDSLHDLGKIFDIVSKYG